MRMYHGTYLDFDAFANSHVIHCFTPDPKVAEAHAKDSQSFLKDAPGGASIIIMPVFLRVLRPFDPRTRECLELMEKWGIGGRTRYDYGEWESLEDLDILAKIRTQGFDGIWMREGEHYNVLAVFHPAQVKSATGNSGRFDPRSTSLTDRLNKGN
jgi:hypothetical protein